MEHNKKIQRKRISYAKWGYIFIIPFFLAYFIFSIVPLFETIYYSFFEYYFSNGKSIWVGPNFIGFDNYATIITNNTFFKYLKNTMIMWIAGFVPQIIISLLLAIWFTDARLKLKASGFFKTIVYMPNLVMASAFATLFLSLFGANGPAINALMDAGILPESFRIVESTVGTRGLIALMNFLMWFGNTTLLLMAGVMGIDPSIYEAAEIDGAGSVRMFKDITFPLLLPIFLYVLITSLIGGIQMFDIPQLFTRGSGSPNYQSYTLLMYLNTLIGTSKNYGVGGALSVLLLIITAILSVIVFKTMIHDDNGGVPKAKKKRGIKNETI